MSLPVIDLPFGHPLLNVILILVAVILGVTILKALLRFTARLSLIGCGAVAAIVAVIWVVSRIR